MTQLAAMLKRAREDDELDALVQTIPYLRFMGIDILREEGEILGRMRFSEHLVGNATVDALHGGTLGALMEVTGSFKLLLESETDRVPKTVNITVEYLRTAYRRDTFAWAEMTRHGRRVANLRIYAYQEARDRLVAAANAHFLL